MKVDYKDINSFSISKSEIKTYGDLEIIRKLISATFNVQCTEIYMEIDEIEKIFKNSKLSYLIKDDEDYNELEIKTVRNKIIFNFDFSNR